MISHKTLAHYREKLVSNWVLVGLIMLLVGGASLSPLGFVLATIIGVLTIILFISALPTETSTVKVPSGKDVQLSSLVDEELIAGVRAGVSVLDIPVFLLDAHGNVLFENAAAEQAFGQIVEGAHISGLLRAPSILELIKDAIKEKAPKQIEHGQKLPVERDYIVRIAPANNGSLKSAEYYALTFRDITELRRMDRMRSDFVANASHELRTPLASLRGFIETILGPAKDDQVAQQRFLGIMLEQSKRMSRLVDDLLSLSRVELRSNITPDQQIDLIPVLSHVHDTLLPLARELDVKINMHLPTQPAMVLGDYDELIQVFQNLVENAVKYGQEGKEVDVTISALNDGKVDVSVADKGQGIPAEHIPRLTERFYRVSITDSRYKKGTGLGLAIVKHILTRHRARLIVRSEVGVGTEFLVRF